ncbi:MAG: hypothetical protein ACO1N0_05215 [Fluviicola sp.]
MKKIPGILAIALFVVLTSSSCRTKANCDAYTSMDQTEKSGN